MMRADQISVCVRPSSSEQHLHTNDTVVKILSQEERLYLYQIARASYLYHHPPSECPPCVRPLKDQIYKLVGSLHSFGRACFLRRDQRSSMSFVLGMIMMFSVNDALDDPRDKHLEVTSTLAPRPTRSTLKITRDASPTQKSEQVLMKKYVDLNYDGAAQSHLRKTKHRQVMRRKDVRHKGDQITPKVKSTSLSLLLPSETLSDSGGIHVPQPLPRSHAVRGSSRHRSIRRAQPTRTPTHRQGSRTPQPMASHSSRSITPSSAASTISMSTSQIHQHLHRARTLWDQGEQRRALMVLTRTLIREIERRDPGQWTQTELQVLTRALQWAQTLQESEALSTLRAIEKQVQRSDPLIRSGSSWKSHGQRQEH